MTRLLLPCLLAVWSAMLSAQPALIPAAPQIAAKAWILMDANSGRVLAEHNADERLPPASLTKLMTSYVLSYELEQGNVKNDDMVTISKNAWAQAPEFQGSSLMWIEVGKQVPLGELHKGIVVTSGNDASVAVAEYLAGSQAAFADVMNQHAQILGMTNTHFVNAHGLPDPDHYTSARDLALLSRALLKFPAEYDLYSLREHTWSGIRQSNRNRLLWRDSSVDGLKTGHTDAAGYCLVASAKRDGMRLISVVMGTSSESVRERETDALLSYGFRYFDTRRLYESGTELIRSKLWAAQQDEIALGVRDDVYLTIPRGQQDKLKAEMRMDDVISGPVTAGTEYGELVVSLDGEELLREPLVALQDIEQAGFFKRIWHSLMLFFIGLFN